MVHLFNVSDRFRIEGRGCVLVPGWPTGAGSPKGRVGDRIKLRLPGGQEIDTRVEAFELINYRNKPDPRDMSVPILLPSELKKEDVPVGTEVHLIES
jgi:hypothetical protein